MLVQLYCYACYIKYLAPYLYEVQVLIKKSC